MAQPGWYPDPKGSGSLRWWNGRHWTENLNPEPPPASRARRRAAGPPSSPGPSPPPGPPSSAGPNPGAVDAAAPAREAAPSYGRVVDATVRGVPLHADEQGVNHGGAVLPWDRVEWVAYWAALGPGTPERPDDVQWIFQAGLYPFRGGPRVEVVLNDQTVSVTEPAGRRKGAAKAVWTALTALCRRHAERRLVDQLVRRVRGGGSVDVAQGLTLHPGGLSGERIALSWAEIAGAEPEGGRIWIRRTGAAPALYVPQQNPNAVLLPALLAALSASSHRAGPR